MKGKVSLYFNAENIGKVRSRVENPSKEFSAEMRQAIQEVCAEVINANILDVRAKMIAKFQAKGYPVKDPKHAAALASTLQPFFDVVVSLKNEFGADTEADGEVIDEPVPADEAKPKKGAKKDEFED